MRQNNNGHANNAKGNRSLRDQATKRGESTSEAWFTAEFNAASRAMWCIALSIVGDRTSAEDIVQESAAIALSKLSEFERGTNFNAWLSRIVRYVALNHARRNYRDRFALTDPTLLDQVPDRAHRVESEVMTPRGELHTDQESFDDRLTMALTTLDPIARACLLLRTLLNLPYREIASALDIPEGTAMSHVHRSRHALREVLRDGMHIRGAKDGSTLE